MDYKYTKFDFRYLQVLDSSNEIKINIINTDYTISTGQFDQDEAYVVVDSIKKNNDNGYLVSGWASDNLYKLPMKSILVVKKGRVVDIIKKMEYRSDVGRYLKSYVDTFGFNFLVDDIDDVLLYFIRPNDKVYKSKLLSEF